ncbi:MAG TPA: HEAT repeat domain-containing protein, partial [Methanomicrobiales archaeon]|nr:HEAT repeat domain-containing protein [Methanomicrobiales archaeon]
MAVSTRNVFRGREPNIEAMVESRNIGGLMRMLRHKNPDIQWQAANALGNMGEDAFDHLLHGLGSGHRDMEIGIIEALGQIGNKRAVPNLSALLNDKSTEVRWAAAIALGELGDAAAVPALQQALQDTDKYVRYGAVLALDKLGYQPATDEERAWIHLGRQDWEELEKMGDPALAPLKRALKDKHADVRGRAVEALGKMGDPRALHVLMRSLGDENPGVRWKAVLAC